MTRAKKLPKLDKLMSKKAKADIGEKSKALFMAHNAAMRKK